jgi:hypothetical protein
MVLISVHPSSSWKLPADGVFQLGLEQTVLISSTNSFQVFAVHR